MDERLDDWTNPAAGLGGVRDKSVGLTFRRRQRLTRGVLEALYEQNPIAARIVDKLPEDAMRKGWELTGVQGVDLPALKSRIDTLKINQALVKWAKWGRLYSGSVLTLPTLDEGSTPLSQPLDLSQVREFFRPQVVAGHNARPLATDAGFASPTFGQTLLYQIAGVISNPVEVHHSRVVPFEAIELPLDAQLES